MLYLQYIDQFFKAQHNPNSQYYVVSFDIVNSKSLSDEEREKLQLNIFIIVKYVYDKLLENEKKLNKQVVIKDEKFVRPWELNKYNLNGNNIDPLVFGDCFQFTVLRNTVTKEEIINLVYECKNNLSMEEEFHISDGYYETNDINEEDKLFRGDCLQILSQKHKLKKEIKEYLEKTR